MKLIALRPLAESVTFHAVELITLSDGSKAYSSRSNKVEKECWVCDGLGYEEYAEGKQHECGYCHGKKTYIDDEEEGPEMNVSNTNGHLIADMLGLDDEDGGGLVKYEDIPAVMKRLIMLKNTDKGDAFVRPDETTHGKTRVDNSGMTPHITRGPTIHSMGVDAQRIAQYVDKLIEIFKYAQENKMHVSWA